MRNAAETMQHDIVYASDVKSLIGTTSGTGTVAGFRNYVDDLVRHPDLPKCVAIISDHRLLDLAKITSKDVRAIIKNVSVHVDKLGDMEHPVVVEREVDFGVSRMYQIRGDPSLPWHVHVCSSLEEAKAWVKSSERYKAYK
jgi:hypothetical protein